MTPLSFQSKKNNSPHKSSISTPQKVEIPAGIDIVIVEGILTFYQKEIREMFHMKIFVEADADTRLSRKGNLFMLNKFFSTS